MQDLGGAGVLEQLKKLYEIQQIDSEITELESQKEALLESLQGLEAKTEALTDQINSISIDVERATRDARDLEATVEADKMKIKKWENRLNDIRNQREYQALSRETENARRQTKDNEAKILEYWEQREKHQSELEQAKAELESVRSKVYEEKNGSDSSSSDLEGQLTSLQGSRSELSPDVNASLLKRYDQVRMKRRGRGLSVASKGTCQSCFMMLPPQLYNTVLRGDSIQNCPACLSFLIAEDHLPESSAEPAAAESDASATDNE